MAALMIEIPVHEEDGWSVPSPPENDVRARLESSRAARSPEEMRRTEEHAARLHDAHVAAVAERAKLVVERALEAKRRRLRMDENSKAKLVQRQEEDERRQDRLSTKRAEQLLRRQEKREAYAAAVRAARAARSEALAARSAADIERYQTAMEKRGKSKRQSGDWDLAYMATDMMVRILASMIAMLMRGHDGGCRRLRWQLWGDW